MSLQAAEPRLVLASGSAIRRTLLAEAGLRFEAVPARVDEAALKQSARRDDFSPDETALLLADAKARSIAMRDPDALVVGCDQLLVCDGSWFDKPADPAAARSQLRSLRGRAHILHTVVLCRRGEHLLWHHTARPKLWMRRFSDGFLETYLALEAERVTSTVGAYRLEGPGIQLFDRIEGDHTAILGLPLLPLFTFLRQHGVLGE